LPQIASILLWIIDLFRLVLLGRIILDWIRGYNPRFSPKGIFLVLAELAYTLTDWVIKPLSKLIKPIKVGGGFLDLSILALFVILIILDSLLSKVI
jgi:YggT family protein